ncbi:bifunctional histidine phosphatase family protein/GNAT family N-acetyltransferase [uncultured Intestinimonas sp.]|uniref:bifunctional histidine phosphatase family protein/GNAT family N-acetyltransferase n=1 Tax=uncultured Intestinimonas sp. TaxID=1689265 RepID=UPI0025E63DA7|nr:bifunctional histidine phosphatase family protein/GNAT family N-acetyltransferase [uncultured Intestinimonas sp.]
MSTTVTKLYLVRHAEAEGNLYRRIHGQYDSLVTDNGYRQIAALAHRFENIPVDAVYSSDLFRTRTTARAIYEPKGLPLTTRKALREVSMGVWEDRTWGEVARTDAEQLRLFNATDARWQVEGGETFQALRERVPAALRQIVRNHPGQTVAVVCHGTAIRNALAVFQGLSIAESAKLPHSDNTAVSLLEFQGEEVRVVFHDDASHLPEEISTFAKQRWWKQDTGSMADANLWFRPLDMEREEDFFRQCRGEAWLNIHGSWDNYDGDAFAADALAQWRFDHNSVICVMMNDEPAGLLHLDLRREADKGIGYIPFVYLLPSYRKRGLGVQLIGQAVSVYRPLGRNYLRLRCAPDNLVAQRFYKRYGFYRVGSAAGTRVPLDLLEKYIGYGEPPRRGTL